MYQSLLYASIKNKNLTKLIQTSIKRSDQFCNSVEISSEKNTPISNFTNLRMLYKSYEKNKSLDEGEEGLLEINAASTLVDLSSCKDAGKDDVSKRYKIKEKRKYKLEGSAHKRKYTRKVKHEEENSNEVVTANKVLLINCKNKNFDSIKHPKLKIINKKTNSNDKVMKEKNSSILLTEDEERKKMDGVDALLGLARVDN